MKLAVNQFFEYRPASQWAFDVTFSNPMVLTNASTIGKNYQLQETNVFTQTDLDRISQCVVSCTQPKFDIDPVTTCYGNFDFTLPIYDVNDIKLVITFEDTDDCLISYKFLSSLMGGSTANGIPAWLNVHEAIRITITEYNTYQYDYARSNSRNGQYKNWNVTSVKHYLCKLCEYTEPNYNRTSESPQATTLKLTFLVIPDGIHLLDNTNVKTAGVEQLDLHGELKKLKENLNKEWNNLVTSKDIVTGYMKGSFDMKDIYEDMKTTLGHIPTSREEIRNWYENNALSDRKDLGQCSRGPGMLLQLYNYVESGAAAKGESVKYRDMTKADLFGKGTGKDGQLVAPQLKDSIIDKTTSYNTASTMNAAQIETELRNKMKPGDYVTFTYDKTDENGNVIEHSQHIVMLGSDNKTFSDFKQNSMSGITHGTNFKITGAYTVLNKNYQNDPILNGHFTTELKAL